MINIGIIGCGKITQKRHIPEYLENVDANLVGFYDLNQARAKEISETFGGTAFDSIEDLLADPSIDAVSVCTANHTHAAITIQALQAGKHVLCEKPMATTLEDCQAMVDAANKAGKVLVIGQNQRLTKTHKKARELIRNGEIGQIIGFRTTFGHGGPETWSIDPGKNTWFFDKNIAVMGAMADLGIHKTDLLLFLTDQKIVETTAHLTTIDKRGADGELIKVDDTAICVYQLENGAIGTMTASWTFYGPEDNTTIIYGTKGIMRLYEDPQFSIQLFLKGGEKIYHQIDTLQTNENQTSSGVIDAFVESVITGQGGELAAGKVLESMKVIFASIESSQTGKTIKVK